MVTLIDNNSAESVELIERARVGDREAWNALDPADREILSLRHFEELTAAEAAQVLGVEESAAAKRYFRALKRLKATLAPLSGGQN